MSQSNHNRMAPSMARFEVGVLETHPPHSGGKLGNYHITSRPLGAGRQMSGGINKHQKKGALPNQHSSKQQGSGAIPLQLSYGDESQIQKIQISRRARTRRLVFFPKHALLQWEQYCWVSDVAVRACRNSRAPPRMPRVPFAGLSFFPAAARASACSVQPCARKQAQGGTWKLQAPWLSHLTADVRRSAAHFF